MCYHGNTDKPFSKIYNRKADISSPNFSLSLCTRQYVNNNIDEIVNISKKDTFNTKHST
jgi:hypothetical protein